MNKKTIFLTISLLVLLTAFVAFSSVYRGKAVNISEEFQIDKDTLVRYSGSDEMCVIPDNVKVIGTAAFEGNNFVKRVALPKDLKEIQYNAFANMDNLERIVIPDSVLEIGPSAFANCSKLDYVYFGKDLEKLGATPFSGCSSLENVEVSDKNNNFTCVDAIIYSADRTRIVEVLPGRQKSYYVIPNQVSAIDPYAFYGCDNLKYVTLSDSIDDISAYAFSNASGLKTLSVSFNTKSISMKAFENCASLEQIYIPDSIKFIHDTAFDGCDKLSIYTTVGTNGEKFGQEKNINLIYSPKFELDIASTMRDKAAEEKYEKEHPKEEPIYDLEKDDSLGATFVVNGQAVVIMDPSSLTVISKEVINEDLNTSTEDLSIRNEEDKKVVVNTGVENYAIPENLFYKNKDLKTIEIPVNTTSIGKFAFARTGLERIELPEGLESIGYGAFYHCDDLKEVVIPSTVTSIDEKAFDNTKWLNDWYKSDKDDYLIVGDGVLLAYKGAKEDFVMPENVKYVSCDIE